MHHYPFNVGSYLLDTVHLDQDEAVISVPRGLVRDIAYRRLIDLYYDIEGPITNKETDWVCSKIRMLKFKPIVASVLKEFFELKDGFWHNEKCDREIARYRRKADAARVNGQLGGRPTNSDTKQKPKKTQSVATRTRTRTNTPLPPEGVEMEVLRSWFEAWWETLPRKVGKPKAFDAVVAALKRGATMAQIEAGAVKHAPYWQAKIAAKEADKVPHPTTWLNRDGWNDDVPDVPSIEPAKEWHETREGIEQKAREIGHDPYRDTQAFPMWAASVKRMAGLIKAPAMGLEELTNMARERGYAQ